MRPYALIPLAFLLVSCNEARQAEQQRIEQLSATLAGLEETLHQIAEAQSTLLTELRETSKARRSDQAAMELNQKDLLLKFSSLTADTAKLSEQTALIAEESRAKPQEFQILTIDLGDVSREISERIGNIRKKNVTATLEEQKKLATLSRRKRDQSLLVMPVDRSTPFQRPIQDLSENEKKQWDELTAEIKALEDEVGHLVVPSANSTTHYKTARAYLRKIYEDTPVIIINSGFHGRDEPVIHAPKSLRVSNITSKVLEEVEGLDDGDELFQRAE